MFSEKLESSVPAELLSRKQFVNWTFERRGKGKPTKVPVRYTDGRTKPISVTDKSNWIDFDDAIFAAIHADQIAKPISIGVGFALTSDDDICGIDLDDVIDDDGNMVVWAESILDELDTYVEISPSGRGVKAFVFAGDLPTNWNNRVSVAAGAIEVYDRDRYFTVTGDTFKNFDAIARIDWKNCDELGKHLRKHPAQRPTRLPPAAAMPVGNDLRRLEDALDAIPDAIADQGRHAGFLRACCEIFRFNADDSEALTLAERWNATKCHPPFPASQVAHKVKSAKAKVSAAGEIGCRLHRSPVATPTVAEPKPPAPSSIESLTLSAPGEIGTLAKWILASSRFPQPQLALGAALAVFSTVTGRRIQDRNGTRTNLYSLALAESCSGKDWPLKSIAVALAAGYAAADLGPTDFRSRAAFTASLQSNPRQLFRLDEADELWRNDSDHMQSLSADLKTIYSESGNHSYIGAGFKSQDETIRLNQPHACLYATATPTAFFDALTPRDVTGGLLGRFLIFTPAERYPRRNVDRRRDDLPASVAKCIAFWSRLANLTHSGDFLPHEDDAINHLEEFGDQMRAEMISAKPSEQPLAAVVGRAAEHAAKLALIAAAATSDSDPITLKQSEWATAVAEHSARTLQEAVRLHVSRSPFDRNCKLILKAIDDCGGTASRAEISRCLVVEPKKLTTCVDHLLESEAIEQATDSSGLAVTPESYRTKTA